MARLRVSEQIKEVLPETTFPALVHPTAHMDFESARIGDGVLQRRRHDVKPGITGWAQVNGRNALDWGRKFDLDLWYVDHQCFCLDILILAKTLLQVVRRDSISQPGHATMPEFLGGAPKP